jgi:hypothetical protein
VPRLDGVERLVDINSINSVGPRSGRQKRLARFCPGDEAAKAKQVISENGWQVDEGETNQPSLHTTN